MFAKQLLEHFQNPQNVGVLDPPAVVVQASNPICGDILKLSANLGAGRLLEVRYQARGCTASIAVGSALTELLIGRSLKEAEALTQDEVDRAVGGLPSTSKHTAVLALDAVRKLVEAANRAG